MYDGFNTFLIRSGYLHATAYTKLFVFIPTDSRNLFIYNLQTKEQMNVWRSKMTNINVMEVGLKKLNE